MRTFQALLPALLFPDTYVGHTRSIPRSFLKCLSPTNDTGRAQSLPRPRAGVPTAGFSSSQDPGWQLGKEAEVPHTPRTDVLQHAKTSLRACTAHSISPQLGTSSFHTTPTPKTSRLRAQDGCNRQQERKICCLEISTRAAFAQSRLQQCWSQCSSPLLSSVPSPGPELGPDPPAQRCGDPPLCSAPRPPLSKSHRRKTEAERYLRQGAHGKHRREQALGSAR